MFTIVARADLHPPISPGFRVRSESGDQVTSGRDDDRRQRSVHGPRRPGRHAGRLDCAIEAFVEMPKPLVVQPVAGLVGVEQGQNETGLVRQPPDPAGRLYVFRGGLWLALHDHATEAADIKADGNHVGRKRHVYPLLWIRARLRQGFLRGGHFVGAFAGR
jgi:hypothetical protein